MIGKYLRVLIVLMKMYYLKLLLSSTLQWEKPM